jgi:alpha-glucoside transport system permease protein
MSKFLHFIRKLNLGSTLGMLILVIIWSTPTLGLLITSLRPSSLADISPWWEALFNPLSTLWTLDAYQTSLSSGMLDSLINTIAVTIPATILPLMIAANAAYAFTFLNFKGKEIFFAILVALMVIPLQSSLIPVLRGMVSFQKAVGIPLTGTYASAWAVHSAFAMPLAIYILRNYMMTLPKELIEAARVDGASNYQIFWQLILPMSVPALASFAIFQFLWVWNDYLVALVFLGDQNRVITSALAAIVGEKGQDWHLLTSGAFISMLLPLAVFFALQRYFVRGLMAGSVKG